MVFSISQLGNRPDPLRYSGAISRLSDVQFSRFGFMDLETAAFGAPVFLVPSHVVHAEAVHEVHGNIADFDFVASIEPLVERSLAPLRLRCGRLGPERDSPLPG